MTLEELEREFDRLAKEAAKSGISFVAAAIKFEGDTPRIGLTSFPDQPRRIARLVQQIVKKQTEMEVFAAEKNAERLGLTPAAKTFAAIANASGDPEVAAVIDDIKKAVSHARMKQTPPPER